MATSVWERPRTHQAIFLGLLLVCAGLIVFDLLHHQHGHFPYEELTGFHAGFGFLAYVAIVSTAKVLRRWVRRPEDYYGD